MEIALNVPLFQATPRIQMEIVLRSAEMEFLAQSLKNVMIKIFLMEMGAIMNAE